MDHTDTSSSVRVTVLVMVLLTELICNSLVGGYVRRQAGRAGLLLPLASAAMTRRDPALLVGLLSLPLVSL